MPDILTISNPQILATVTIFLVFCRPGVLRTGFYILDCLLSAVVANRRYIPPLAKMRPGYLVHRYSSIISTPTNISLSSHPTNIKQIRGEIGGEDIENNPNISIHLASTLLSSLN